MEWEILSEIGDVEVIATGRRVRIRHYLERTYGPGRWRKMKGKATVRLADGHDFARLRYTGSKHTA